MRPRVNRSRRAAAWLSWLLVLFCACALTSCAAPPVRIGARAKWQPIRFKAFFRDRFGTIQNIELRGNTLTSLIQGSSVTDGMYCPLGKEQRAKPTPADWNAFKAALDRADVWAWKGRYTNADFRHGSAWSIEIVYPKQRIVAAGYGAYPSDKAPSQSADTESQRYQSVVSAIERIIGRRLFN